MTRVPPGAQRILIRTLADIGVDFVLIGGHAVSAHGYERATRDVDIVYDAFDAAVSAVQMARHVDELLALEQGDEVDLIEGRIWYPGDGPSAW